MRLCYSGGMLLFMLISEVGFIMLLYIASLVCICVSLWIVYDFIYCVLSIVFFQR